MAKRRHLPRWRQLGGELLLLASSAAAVWRLVPNAARVALGVATTLMAVAAWVNARIPVVLGDLANTVADAQNRAQRWHFDQASGFLLALAAMFFVRELLQVARKYVIHNTGTRLEKQVTVEVFANLMRANLAWLSQNQIGALHGKTRRSAEGFARFVMLCFMDFVPSVMVAAFAVAVAFQRHALLGAVMLGVVPVASYIVARQVASQKGIRLQLLRSKETVDAVVVEQLAGIETVRAANTHGREVRRIDNVCEDVRRREFRHHFQMSLFDFGKAINESAFFIAVVGLSVALVAKGDLAAGEIITFSMLFASVLSPLREVHRIVDEAHESALKVRDLLDLLAEPHDPSFLVADPTEPCLDGSVPAIELRSVTVDYRCSDGSQRRGVRDVSLTVPRGGVVGVAGPTGSGKSTWLRALLRLIHPTKGQIMIGGAPIEQVSREALARLVGYVGQSPFVFAGTIGENLAYGCGDVSREDLLSAAEAAALLKDIDEMPGGLDAPVLEGGRNLSGGQRQRIALARIFLKAPPIIVLDEATSALDNTTERRVLDALKLRLKGRTIVMIAHRLSTLRAVDQVYVFAEGQIAQAGTFEQLALVPGIFSELLQSASDESGPRCAPAETMALVSAEANLALTTG